MRKDLGILVILILVGLVGALILKSFDFVDRTQNPGPITPSPVDETPVVPKDGFVTLKIGEKGTVGNVSLTPIDLVEDSRCAIDVICVWAGTVKVKVRISSGLGTSENIIELGKSITTEAEEVVFAEVSPSRMEGEPVPEGQYRFTFQVKKRSITDTNPDVPLGKCYVGGCSGQICSDQEGMASTCEFRPEYACYGQNSRCERQANGECGWTQTPALALCLQNAE